MRKELISVIVPVHNGQAYLENCIDSIERQTYDNLEIMVVNDGSTDRTAEICEQLQAKYENIEVYTLADLGVSAARNHAIDRAKGEYVTFVDADDRLCPDTLRYLYERINAADSDMAGCRFALWSTEDEWRHILKDAEMKNVVGESGDMTGSVKENCYDRYQYLTDSILMDNCRCWSKLYRRQLIDRVRFREGLTVGEDMLFLVDVLPYLERAVETTYPGYGYYRNPGGVMQRPFAPSYMDQIRCWEIAQEAILQMDEGLRQKTAAKIITAVMLTVGKIALCSAKERRVAREYLEQCRTKLKDQLRVRGSTVYLPKGYNIKVKLFYHLPGMYVWLYQGLQMIKNRRGGVR